MKKIYILLSLLVMFMIPKIVVSAENFDDGTYIITSALNSSSVIDLSGGKVSNSRNIQIYVENKTPAQRWVLRKRSDGYYNIVSSINNNYVLDVSGAKFKNSTNVQLYRYNNSNAQKWKIADCGDGYYNIISYDNNYVLDVSGGNYYNGTNIQIYKNNGTNAQKFLINRYYVGSKTIENGIYTINSFDENYALDLTNSNLINGNGIQLYSNTNKVNQRWEIKYINNGYYSIKPYLSYEYSLDDKNASKKNNSSIQLYSFNNSDAQQWIIKDNGDGYYKIISKRNGMVLNVKNNNFINNAQLELVYEENIDSQKFKLNKIENYGYKNINDGYYFIGTKLNTNKVLDIASGKISENTNIQIYETNSTLAQKWYIKYIDNGYYAILSNKDENYALTSESLNSSNIKINSFNNLDTQRWIIRDNGNGYFSIMNKNGNSIDILYGQSSNGTNVQLYQNNNSNAQQFKLIPTVGGLTERVLDNGYYFIESALNENMVVDLKSGNTANGSNVQLYQKNSTKAQKWYVSYISNGYYKITSGLNNNKSLDVSGASTYEGSNVQIYQSNNSLAQQWIIKDAGDGTFYIISNCNGLYLDIDNGIVSNSSNIEMNSFSSNQSQKFRFVKTRLENLVIDVSQYQGNIDWNVVKSKSGIYGVILRIGFLNIEDTKFAEYIKEVKRLNIPYGIYLFSYATDMGDVNKEATFVNNMIYKYNLNPTLGIYYDLEDWTTKDGYSSAMNTKAEYDQFISSFVNQVKNSYNNYEVKVYASTNFANQRFGDVGRNYVGWIAEWSSSCTYNGYYKMWQYSNNGSIPGISTRVDLSYYYLD